MYSCKEITAAELSLHTFAPATQLALPYRVCGPSRLFPQLSSESALCCRLVKPSSFLSLAAFLMTEMQPLPVLVNLWIEALFNMRLLLSLLLKRPQFLLEPFLGPHYLAL